MVNGTLLNFGKRYEDDLPVIFDQWPKLHLGLDALSNQKILKGIYCAVSEDNLPEAVEESIEDDENCEFTFRWKVLILFLLSVWLIFIIYVIWTTEYLNKTI